MWPFIVGALIVGLFMMVAWDAIKQEIDDCKFWIMFKDEFGEQEGDEDEGDDV